KIIAFDPDDESTEGELWSFTTGSQDPDCPSSFTDERNDKTYEAVQVGVQCWMAENLDFGEMLTSGQATDNSTTEKFCYQDNENNCDDYGGLYQWDELMQYTQVEEVGGICPEGWHLPSENEWHYLVEHHGGSFAAGKRLKEGGSSGFEALLAGTRNTSSNYEELDLKGYYWSSTQLDEDEALLIHFDDDIDGVFFNYGDKDRANSVRCVKN
ncbi:MAG: FISUMP domain-containing protein, partial [Bacteroidota bacterium]